MAGGFWTLDHDGHRLEVGTERTGWKPAARLRVDGAEAGEVTGGPRLKLPYGEMTVVVAFDVLGLLDGQAARCELAPPDRDEDGPDEKTEAEDEAGGGKADSGGKPEPVPFTPPEGTRAAKREALALSHPTLYASRHMVVATGKVLFPLLGVSALIHLLLDMVVWPDVRLPKADLPSIPWPDIPWPDVPLPDVSLPPWLRVILATTKFWVPILIAAGVTAKEAGRRKRQRDQRAAEKDATGEEAAQKGSEEERERRPASRTPGSAGR